MFRDTEDQLLAETDLVTESTLKKMVEQWTVMQPLIEANRRYHA
jgi:hypothetical protein